MTKYEAINKYSKRLEKTLNHPIIPQRGTLKSIISRFSIMSFEMGWISANIESTNEEEINAILKKYEEEFKVPLYKHQL